MELIKLENNQLSLNEEVSTQLKALYEAKIEFDVKMDAVKNAMLEAMEKNNIKSFENDFLKVVYKAPSVRKSVDTARLKEEGLYDLYLKESPVKSSVTVTFK